MLRKSGIALGLLLALAASGCAARKNRPVSPRSSAPSWLQSLTDGQSEKSSLVSRLGEPSSTFESGRILAYRLNKKYEVIHGWAETRFNVILVFDENDVLERHRLVRVK